MQQRELIPHLFRTEFRKITSVLCKTFGLAHVEVAEDIACETFLQAAETWPYKGVPENPTAWLYLVAKNKAKNYLKHDIIFAQKVSKEVRLNAENSYSIDIDLSSENINDSQLKMLFAICHPSISPEQQIGLALRILCGFGIDEIATALLTTKETVNKRLFRAKEKLRDENTTIEFPDEPEIGKRLDVVLTTLYLLFTEGYYSEDHEVILRDDLCREAIRLTVLLTENARTDTTTVNALLALMYFHSSRFNARKKEDGGIVLYEDQDESQWDQGLIAKGAYHLHRSSYGPVVSRYHLEASIAYWHTIKTDTIEKWNAILQLFNRLLQIEYSPIAALNRTYALSKVQSKQAAIIEAEKLKLTSNHFYFVLLGELYTGIDNARARDNYVQALALTKTSTEKSLIQTRLDLLLI